MSRPLHPRTPAADAARDALPAAEIADFDRLAHAVLSAPSSALGPVLRAQLPGGAGVRWLASAGLSPTTRVGALAAEQWLSLFRCWQATGRVPSGGPGSTRGGGRPSTHGHAPGAQAIPRWQ
ncbi:hypothetical protein [Trujillonella endophytica]|uniref:Uncharacterized protein n=1 Tax=Trujillonella endophytica TaxID=673521 RepID=A0A1H8VJS0_9ACTN|nr:hypothetical protein [Trujillella endophytica]SEP15665.1 hypothetical protein SAMN05660991_03613 [Trujillella endophytica]